MTAAYIEAPSASKEHHFELPYDVLIVAVGAINNTFDTPGVEQHAFFLKVPPLRRILLAYYGADLDCAASDAADCIRSQ